MILSSFSSLMKFNLYFQDALPSWKSLRATRTFHIARGTMERTESKRPITGT
jgi:hypothetical protein